MTGQFSLLYQEKKITYVVFDTETTGLNPYNGDAVIEIAALKINENGDEIDRLEHFINPRIPISPGASLIHGLTDEFIAKNGSSLAEIMPKFYEFCKDAILVGHNIVKFDISFINKHLNDLGLSILSNNTVDTLPLARQKLKLTDYKLRTVAENFGIPYINAHRAMNDVMINKEVFLELMKI